MAKNAQMVFTLCHEHRHVLLILRDSPLVHLFFFFTMAATISLSGVWLIFQMVNLVSLCCDVCAVLKHRTGFHRRRRRRSAAQPRAFKHEQIKARGFVPGTVDCCKFNVVSSEMCMMLLFSPVWMVRSAHSPPVLKRTVLFVSSRLLVCVWLASFNTLFGRSIFVFFFVFWVHPTVLNLFRFTHTLLWGRWCNKCPAASFSQHFSQILLSLLHVISVNI